MKTTLKLIDVSELPELLACGKMRLTKDELRKLVASGKVSIDVAHSILGTKANSSPVAGLPTTHSESVRGDGPETKNAREKKVTRRVAGQTRFRVLIIRVGHDWVDDDGIDRGYKQIRDQIASEFGLDDGDFRIEWEYGQVRTRGAVGTIVRIERL